MEMTKPPRTRRSKRRYGDVSPSPAADEELRWFFNEAEIEVDQPSNFCALLAGMSPNSLEEVERRAEALHAAAKIRVRLQAISRNHAMLLEGLYKEKPWPRGVARVLGDVAGAMEASAMVRASYLRALARCRTQAKNVTAWLEELIQTRGADALADWRRDVERDCAIAVSAYERVRGTGPSVVPHEEED